MILRNTFNTLVLIVCSSVLVMGQSLDSDALNQMRGKWEQQMKKLRSNSSLIADSDRIRQDVYLTDEWVPGAVYFKDGSVISGKLKYNVQHKRVEAKLYNEVRALSINSLHGVELNQRLFIPLSSGESMDGTGSICYEVLVEGEMALLLKHNLVKYKSGGSSLLPNMGTTEAFKSEEEIYYCLNGQKVMKLKKGKKNVSPVFGQHSVTVEAFADKNDFGYKKLRDLIALFRHYNVLLKGQFSNE